MNTRLRILLYAVMVVALALGSAGWVEPVLADGGAPPPNNTPASTSSTGSVKLPAGTGLVVTDKGGHKVPLGSKQAADLLADGDPIWCPSTVLVPVDGGAGCTSHSDSLASLIAAISGETVNGTIWIKGDYLSGTNDPGVTSFSLYATGPGGLGTTANYALTIKGGWNGLGTGTMDSTNPSEFDGATLSITEWGNNVTLYNILIHDTAGPGAALTVETSGAITLNNVETSYNPYRGAQLDNTAGVAKPVTITNSTFNHNALANQYTDPTIPSEGQMSLWVSSAGAITLKDVTAVGTWNFSLDGDVSDGGAYLDNTAGTAGVTLLGTNIFSENEWGLGIWSKGNITVNNLVANSNTDGSGAYIDACIDNGSGGCLGTGNVTFTGTSQAKFNNRGLFILANGNILLNNVTASSNDQAWSLAGGVNLNNSFNTSVGNVTLTGTNIFQDNAWSGLQVFTNGAIALNNIVAGGNGFGVPDTYGAYLDNTSGSLPKLVTLTGSSTFYNNYSGGLYINATGPVVLNNLSADGNSHGEGVAVINTALGGGMPQNVTLLGSGNFNNNFSNGLGIYTYGAIMLANVSADANGHGALDGYGAFLDNCGYDKGLVSCNGKTPKPVTLSGNNEFGSNYSGGLWVTSLGAITLNNLNADNNLMGSGAYLDDHWPGAVGGITVNNTATYSPSTAWNHSSGLEAYSLGNILIKDLDAYQNGSYGVYLDNYISGSGTGNVSVGTARLNWCNGQAQNGNAGLSILSRGMVTLYNLCNNYNKGYGAYVDNHNAIVPKPVTLFGNNTFSNDWDGGLHIDSKGAITLYNVTATDSGAGFGVYLKNSFTGASGGITVNGKSEFARNWLSGIEAYSKGNITLANLDAYENGQAQLPGTGYGAYLDNYMAGEGTGSVSVGTSLAGWYNNFNNNFYSGLEVHSNGSVTLRNVTAKENGGNNGVDTPYGYGLLVQNPNPGSPKPVTLLRTTLEWDVNNYSNNTSGGLRIETSGAVTLTSVQAQNNGSDGIYVDNFTGNTLVQPVTINGYANSYYNAGYGLFVDSLGAIKVASLDSRSNVYGADLNNDHNGALGGITITGGAWTGENANFGLQATSRGPILFSLTDAWGGNNGSFGWTLDNRNALTPQPVTLTVAVNQNLDFNENGTYGLLVRSLGNIFVVNLDAWNNKGGFGAQLDNAWLGGTGTVTVTATKWDNSFGNNAGDGLDVFSNRAITINKVNADSNANVGVYLGNVWYDSASLLPNISLTGYGNFNNNGDTGLLVTSFGTILVNNLDTNNNGQNAAALTGWGAYLDNCGFDWGKYDCTNTTAPRSILVGGANNFNDNYQDGLWATSFGLIKVNSPNANGNGGDGAYLDNGWTNATGGITLTGTGNFTSNGYGFNNGWTAGLGLEAWTSGSVLMNNVSANWNHTGGALINATSGSGPQSVTLTGNNLFIGNNDGDDLTHEEDGLDVFATGSIAINNLTGSFNDGDGVFLNNCLYNGVQCAGSGNVTLTNNSPIWLNYFIGNSTDGLYIDSHGTVTLNKITADKNGQDGVSVGTDGSILVACGSMTNNGGFGWSLGSYNDPLPGTIKLKGVFSFGNGTDENLWGGTLIKVLACP